jgi:hypothetical protein
MSIRRFIVLGNLACLSACTAAPPRTSPEVPARRDPRVGLRAGLHDAAEAMAGVRLTAQVRPPAGFERSTSSDLAFKGNYAIQGNYNGILIWDIANPARPSLASSVVCPASQNDVSVHGNLLFVSTEGFDGRTDCGTRAFTAADSVSPLRHRGVRIFDISDIRHPKLVKNVQTCRGSHTHTVVESTRDRENIYVYVSGSFVVRSPNELAGCERRADVANTSLMQIEIIRVPLANPGAAEIVRGARIFAGLGAPPQHGPAPEDTLGQGARVAAARAEGAFVFRSGEGEHVLDHGFARYFLDSLASTRGRTQATAEDSAYLRANIQAFMEPYGAAPPRGPDQCHDITVYPALGLAAGACEGYGLLLDISDPVTPRRIDAVADANFSYWHAATFNNDGTKVLFTDEWGGGVVAKCRATDPTEWGANAIFTIDANRRLRFHSYYKLPAVQTAQENCVAHNGSLVPIPGRDVMVQAWYQGGISVFDWTDPARPYEIAFFDRGPADSTRLDVSGAWSAYWYNGHIYSSEISRGFDVLDLTPSEHLTQNEIDAAKTVRMAQFNAQGQPKLVWPPSFALARAYADQLERSTCLRANRLREVRSTLRTAESADPVQRREALLGEARRLENDSPRSCDGGKLRTLASTLRDLSGATP